ncbi:MAG: MmcQ/YjbR family DNA-binding protein [Candidatus Saccharibacteria bacterium]|nr:MmcQ/YjbR family DNA-binding protein [Candidatus Saccharibacteria bacterium]
MVFDISKVSGIGEYTFKTETVDEKERTLYFKNDKAFLVVNKNTIEVRTDEELRKLLVEKYESVMESRYFGKGGIEIVLAGKQFSVEELDDLVRLSYNLS